MNSHAWSQLLPWWFSGKQSTCQCRRCGLDTWVLGTRLLCPQNSPGRNTGMGLPLPSSGDLPNSGIEPAWATREAHIIVLPKSWVCLTKSRRMAWCYLLTWGSHSSVPGLARGFSSANWDQTHGDSALSSPWEPWLAKPTSLQFYRIQSFLLENCLIGFIRAQDVQCPLIWCVFCWASLIVPAFISIHPSQSCWFPGQVAGLEKVTSVLATTASSGTQRVHRLYCDTLLGASLILVSSFGSVRWN